MFQSFTHKFRYLLQLGAFGKFHELTWSLFVVCSKVLFIFFILETTKKSNKEWGNERLILRKLLIRHYLNSGVRDIFRAPFLIPLWILEDIIGYMCIFMLWSSSCWEGFSVENIWNEAEWDPNLDPLNPIYGQRLPCDLFLSVPTWARLPFLIPSTKQLFYAKSHLIIIIIRHHIFHCSMCFHERVPFFNVLIVFPNSFIMQNIWTIMLVLDFHHKHVCTHAIIL